MDAIYTKSFSSLLRHPSSIRSPRSIVHSQPDETPPISSVEDDVEGRLGLTTIYAPPISTAAVGDFVFIHGLGGSSHKTWSHSGDARSCWPKSWLSVDPDFVDIRIHVFGYSAKWKEREKSGLSISDFAHSLVAELKNDPGIRRDTSRITLIGHSMGGCVAKKAYIMANQDPSCKDLVSRFHSMVFLGTPHRGSELAPVLENILTLAWATKPFVNDLSPGSAALEDINDAFRHYASSLRLWSFYETKPVKTKFLNRIIVEKGSSTLGYPNEEIAAMNCDHRHLCKFESRLDPNYRLLRNSLHTVVDLMRRTNNRTDRKPSEISFLDSLDNESFAEYGSRSMEMLNIVDTSEDDLAALQAFKEPGSCEWFTQSTSFMSWEQRSGPHILWLTGLPAAGKTVISTHVVDHLKMSSNFCSYFFFKHGKVGKATLADCFLSIAYQMAMQDVVLRHEILRALRDQTTWDRADEGVIWRKLFAGCIFKADLSHHYWIIDGVDECAGFNSLFSKRLLAMTPNALRIFCSSRDLEEVARGLVTLGPNASKHGLSEEDTLRDMHLFLSTRLEELDRFEQAEDLQEMCDRILKKSRGSFLWLRLVLKEFESVWTDEDMEAALEGVPSDLHEVYHRILQSIESDPRKMKLAKPILTWVVLANRPLSIEELRCAIKLDVGQTLQNLTKSIPSICGQLVSVDQSSRVQIIHETARQFLLDSNVDSRLIIHKTPSQTRLSFLLLGYLKSDVLKSQQKKTAQIIRPKTVKKLGGSATQNPEPALLSYATHFFSEHIYRSDSDNDNLIRELHSFLKSPNSLYWIEYVVREVDFGVLTQTAMNFRKYLEQKAQDISPKTLSIDFVDQWVSDLIRMAAKFRAQLQACPSAIFRLIPSFCPSDSVLFPSEAIPSPLLVKNLPVGTWDDCLTRIDFISGHCKACAFGKGIFAVGLSTRSIVMYDSVSLQRLGEIMHPDAVETLAFSPGDELIVSYSRKNLVVWDVTTGRSILSSVLPLQPLAVTFLGTEELLLVSGASQLTKCIRRSLETGSSETFPLYDDNGLLPRYLKEIPMHATFSPASVGQDIRLSVGYRIFPTAIWSPLELNFLGSCGTGQHGNGVIDTLFNPNPEIQALVVSYGSGNLCLYDYTTMELKFSKYNVNAYRMSWSQDGHALVVGTGFGKVKIFEFNLSQVGEFVLELISQVNAFDNCVKDMAFSSSGIRFIAIGHRQCQVWEPATAMRKDRKLAGSNEAISQTAKSPNVPSEQAYAHITTTMVAMKDGSLILAGKSDGSVAVFSSANGLEMGIAYSHGRGAAVRKIAAAETVGLVASADEGGRVFVAILEAASRDVPTEEDAGLSEVAARVVIHRQFGRVISRLLMNETGDRLLLGGNDVDELWELPSGKLLMTRESSTGADLSRNTAAMPCRIVSTTYAAANHPKDKWLFILITDEVARVFSWIDFADLTPNGGIILNRPATFVSSFQQTEYIVGLGMILEHNLPSGGLKKWPAEAFDPSSSLAGQPCEDPYLDELAPAVLSILGFSGASRLQFIDRDLWICSTEIQSPPPGLNFDLASRSYRPGQNPSLSFPIARDLSQNPGTFVSLASSDSPVNPGNSSSFTARHFFALSDWCDAQGMLNCAIFEKGPRKGNVQFAFAAGHCVVLVEGGIEFSQKVVPNTNGRTSIPSLNSGTSQGDCESSMYNVPSEQYWTVVSSSMYRRASNWI
ncbi:hypothetical protein S7711_08753 [Stachybotrys chartarum IBT 7711]|uniref:Uncharacterized protein n=1 Tax=Stachybotrys chartarum (strain CBS 109288 / IBT 7711) TaxID=1280523 RepID=A0A084AJN9_STACB|nr:hypothetical protein S7711_08753 [Stachybotrys chartarum IBT 7711]